MDSDSPAVTPLSSLTHLFFVSRNSPKKKRRHVFLQMFHSKRRIGGNLYKILITFRWKKLNLLIDQVQIRVALLIFPESRNLATDTLKNAPLLRLLENKVLAPETRQSPLPNTSERHNVRPLNSRDCLVIKRIRTVRFTMAVLGHAIFPRKFVGVSERFSHFLSSSGQRFPGYARVSRLIFDFWAPLFRPRRLEIRPGLRTRHRVNYALYRTIDLTKRNFFVKKKTLNKFRLWWLPRYCEAYISRKQYERTSTH